MSSPPEDELEIGVWEADLSSFSADMVAGLDGKTNLPHTEMVIGNYRNHDWDLPCLAQNIRCLRYLQPTVPT
jgi:hypothetical protein